MKVFKFGGASVKSPAGIRNTVKIIQGYSGQPILVVVSAMGKTTNVLEHIHMLSHAKKDFYKVLTEFKDQNSAVVKALFPIDHLVHEVLDKIFKELEDALKLPYPFDQVYDQVVSKGELISSYILHHFLLINNLPSLWVDARQYILTDETYREGKINWEATEEKIETLGRRLKDNIIVTQGFIGSTQRGFTTTLGREGSDFTAAIFGYCLNAESVTIWKDVPGVMSSDPKRLSNATVFTELPYKEAAEMTYYGASVIHPKTIKPLANRNIPLYVKNFDDPSLSGTIIHDCKIPNLPPLIVFKGNQCLISCKVTDYTFVNEQQLSMIFQALSELDIKINMMQNSAISFSFCSDFRESTISGLIE
jgi:aspartate kinase